MVDYGRSARCFALFALLAAATWAGDASPRTHTVVIENMRFDPAELEVKIGDHVAWVNKDLFPHTATADDKTFDSGSIDVRSSWNYSASASGEHAYGCAFHPTMKGKLTVR